MFACIHIPDFPVQAVLRLEPLSSIQHRPFHERPFYDRSFNNRPFNDRPVAVLDGTASLQTVFSCNEAARLLGISPGITKLQAEAFSALILRHRSLEAEEAAQAALLDCACSFSIQIESTAPGSVLFDVSGTECLFGPKPQLGAGILQSVARFGLHANVAIAESPDTAFYAARGFAGLTVIQPGEEEGKLSVLPLGILNIAPEVLAKFARMGIVRFAALAALPSAPLCHRFGQAGLALQAITRGGTHRLLVPVKPLLRFVEAMALEDPLEDLESLAFLLNRLLDQIVERLKARSLATDTLHLQLALEVNLDRDIADNHPPSTSTALHQRTIKLPVATQEAGILLKLLQLDLAGHAPNAAVRKILLEAEPAAVRVSQGGLFDRIAPEPEQLEILLARIRGIVGDHDQKGRNRAGTPVVQDTHAPDAFRMRDFFVSANVLPSQGLSSQLLVDQAQPRIALRRYRPPLAASVRLREKRPMWISFGAHSPSAILSASGPWINSGSWWESLGQWARDEWDISLRAGPQIEVYRIYRDHKTCSWFVEGVYD